MDTIGALPLFDTPGELMRFVLVVVIGLAVTAAVATLASGAAVRHIVPRCRKKWVRALAVVAVVGAVVWLWDILYVVVLHENDPYSGCPDDGIGTSYFMLRFAFSGYMREYSHAPWSHCVLLYSVAAAGFVVIGYCVQARIRLGWIATAVAVFAYGAVIMRTVIGLETGFDFEYKMTFPWYLRFAGPCVAEAVSLALAGAALAHIAHILRARKRG